MARQKKDTRQKKDENANSEDRRKYRSDTEKKMHELDERKKKEKERQAKEYHKRAQDWDRKSRVTPWLLIRCTLTDMGLRPLPNGVKHWLSPDITVESSDPLGNPVADENNFLHALIFNLGEVSAAPTQVDFYWADPSIGLSAAHMNFIGTEWVEVKSLNAVDVRCNTPWVPNLAHGAHQCLKVNCTNHILDPILHPFQPKLDRHAGQRNVTVVESKAGEFLKFSLKLNNLFALKADQSIHIRTQRLTLAADTKIPMDVLIDHALIAGDMDVFSRANLMSMFKGDARKLKDARTVSRFLSQSKTYNPRLFNQVKSVKNPLIKTGISEEYRFIENPNADVLLGNLLLNKQYTEKGKCMDTGHGMAMEAIALKPFEQRNFDLEIQIPQDAEKDEFIAIHLLQESHDLAIGGYSILVKVL